MVKPLKKSRDNRRAEESGFTFVEEVIIKDLVSKMNLKDIFFFTKEDFLG